MIVNMVVAGIKRPGYVTTDSKTIQRGTRQD